MSVTDIAVERQHVLLAASRRADGRGDPALSKADLARLLEQAVPCYWAWPALQRATSSAATFSEDACVLRTDLLAPVQWWYLDMPTRYKVVAATQFAEAPEALLIADGAIVGGELCDSLVVVVCCLVHDETRGLYPIPMPAFIAYVPFDQPCGQSRVESFLKSVPLDEREIAVVSGITLFAVSGLYWMRSTVARTERVAASRQARRRLSLDATHPAATCRVITLRHLESTAANAEPKSVAWTCRWLVPDYWRSQVVRGARRPTLVHSHIKGPADKPFRAPRAVRYKIDR